MYAVDQLNAPQGHASIWAGYAPYTGTDTDSEAFASSTTRTTTHSVNTSAGDFMAIFAVWNTTSAPPSVASITDPVTGQTFVNGSVSHEVDNYIQDWRISNAAVGPNTFTVTFNTAVAFDIMVAVVHHVDSSPLDLAIPAKQVHSSTSVGHVTTTVAGDLLVAGSSIGRNVAVSGTSSTAVINTTDTAALTPALSENLTTTLGAANAISLGWVSSAYGDTIGFAVEPSTALAAPTALAAGAVTTTTIPTTWTNPTGGGHHVNSTDTTRSERPVPEP